MLYIRKNKDDDIYSHSAEIRSLSEDTSKPIRTTAVKIVAPSPSLSNNQIVVAVPNVRKPVPLFILMRALGVISDKDIIKTCLLDLVDAFARPKPKPIANTAPRKLRFQILKYSAYCN
jgi:DNA-directed RNA polymerase II subunit RPB2